jgi:hypothetical protein
MRAFSKASSRPERPPISPNNSSPYGSKSLSRSYPSTNDESDVSTWWNSSQFVGLSKSTRAESSARLNVASALVPNGEVAIEHSRSPEGRLKTFGETVGACLRRAYSVEADFSKRGCESRKSGLQAVATTREPHRIQYRRVSQRATGIREMGYLEASRPRLSGHGL